MGKFHDAMLRDLEIRGYARATCEHYLRAMRELVRFHMRSPDRLTAADMYLSTSTNASTSTT